MSGLEIFAVVGVVASIVSAYADGQKVLKNLKEKRKAKKEQRSKDAKTEEDGLQVSLKTGEDKIREQYNHDALQLGQKFAIGDQAALEALKVIQDDLYLVKQHLRARADGRVDPRLMPIDAMNEMSEHARASTMQILFELAQRLSDGPNMAQHTRNRYRGQAPHAVLSLEIGLPSNVYGSPSHTQELNSQYMIIPGQSEDYTVPWLMENLRTQRMTSPYGTQQQSILASMQRATLTHTGNNSMARNSLLKPGPTQYGSISKSDSFMAPVTQGSLKQSRTGTHRYIEEEAHPGDRRIDVPTPESSQRSSLSEHRGLAGPSRQVKGPKTSLASHTKSKVDARPWNSPYNAQRSSSFDMDSMFPSHDPVQRGKEPIYDSTDGESQHDDDDDDDEEEDQRIENRGKRSLTYVSSHQDELENDIYEFFEAKPEPLRISKSPTGPLVGLSISPKDDNNKKSVQVEDFPLPPTSKSPKSPIDFTRAPAPSSSATNSKEGSSKLFGPFRKPSLTPGSPSDYKRSSNKLPIASSLATRVNSTVTVPDTHTSSISSGEGNARLTPASRNSDLSKHGNMSRMASSTTTGSSDTPVGADYEINPLKSQDDSMRIPLEIIPPVNFQPERPYLPSDENNYAGYCKGAWHLQMRNRKKAYESRVRPSGISSNVGFYKCRYCNFEMRMVTDPATKKGCIDPKFYDTHGLWYRHEFLFRSHIPCKGLNFDPKISLKLGCMFCTAEGLGTKVFENVAKFMAHLQTHRCETAAPKGETLLHNMNAVVGRGPMTGDTYDVFFPPLDCP